MRCATVGGLTRNALPISSVVRRAHFAKSERDLRVERERGMAAREDQPQAIVFDAVVDRFRRLGGACGDPLGELRQRRVEARAPAHGVDRLEAAGRDEPRTRVVGQPLTRPLLDGRRKRVVHRLFGAIEIAEQADQRRQHAPRVGAVDGIHHLPRALAGNVSHRYLTAKTLRRHEPFGKISAPWRLCVETTCPLAETRLIMVTTMGSPPGDARQGGFDEVTKRPGIFDPAHPCSAGSGATRPTRLHAAAGVKWTDLRSEGRPGSPDRGSISPQRRNDARIF